MLEGKIGNNPIDSKIDYMTTAPASDLLSGRDKDLDHSFVKGSNTSTADIVFLAR